MVEAKLSSKATFIFRLYIVTRWRDLRDLSQNLSCVVTLSVLRNVCNGYALDRCTELKP